MEFLKLESGHFAEHKKTKRADFLKVDITDFTNGYGELSNLDKHIELLKNLKEEGWESEGISYEYGHGGSIETVNLELINKK